jgi:hypothetical protein
MKCVLIYWSCVFKLSYNYFEHDIIFNTNNMIFIFIHFIINFVDLFLIHPNQSPWMI